MERRRHDRITMHHLLANLSDGHGFFSATIADVSRFGIRIANVSRKLNSNALFYWIVFATRKQHFKLKVRPAWTKAQPPAQHIGLEIIHVPLGWLEFIMESEGPYSDFADMEL